MIENIKQFELNKERFLQEILPDKEVKKALEHFVDYFQGGNEFTLKLPPKKPSVRFIPNYETEILENKRKIAFSFIINKHWLLFYVKTNYEYFLSPEINENYKPNINIKKKEFSIKLKNINDVDIIINDIFIKKLKLDIYSNGTSSIELPEIIVIDEFIKQSEEVNKETVTEVITKHRTGQQKYRKDLLKKWDNQCAVTRINIESILIASHIKSFKESDFKERYDVENGILLSPTLDALFDRHLISFKEKGSILLSGKIMASDFQKLGISLEMRLKTVTPGMIKYLKIHQKIFYEL